MSTSNLTYKDYSFGNHGEVYHILEKVFAGHGIKYYLIGANARDIHLYKAGIKPTRLTGDIDFAIMVPDIATYEILFDELCTLGFKRTKEVYRLIYTKTDTIIDLMPYGEIEQERTVNFSERNISLSALGFKEVGTQTQEISIGEAGFSLPATPLEGIIILKLVSWNERPLRTKDLDDISYIITNAWDIYEEEAYADHLDLFEVEDFEMTIAAARILGRKMKVILIQNDALNQTIIKLLEKSVAEKTKAENPELAMAQNMNKSLEEVQKILAAILSGIND